MTDENTLPSLAGQSGAERFHSLYKTGLFSDITLKIIDPVTKEASEIKAHKCILAMTSSVWETAIKWCNKDVLEISDYPKNIMECILSFAYNDMIELESVDFCLSVIQAADFYNITKLMEKCDEYLRNVFLTRPVSTEEFVKIFNNATLYGLEKLIEACLGYIEDNSKEFFQCDDFFNLSQDSITIIAIMDKYLCTEYVLIQSILKWTSKNSQDVSLRSFLLDSNILKVFRLRTLHYSDTIKLFDEYPDVFNAEEKYVILKSSITNMPIDLDFLDSNTMFRGRGNIENNEEIIVGSPPMVISEVFAYVGEPTSIPVFSIELEPRSNSFVPKCRMNYEECVTINLPGYSMDFDGIAARTSGTVVNIRNPIQIQIQNLSSFKVEIILRRSGIYKKSSFLSRSYIGLMRVKKGLIRDINHREKVVLYNENFT